MKILCKGLENFDCPKMLITNPVRDAVQASSLKLIDVIFEVRSIKRILIYPGTDIYKHYEIVNEGNEIYGQVWIFPLEEAFIFRFRKIEKEFELNSKNPKCDQNIKNFAHWALFEELFLQFARLETKILPPSRQIWDGPICKYNNKTKSDITIVDSTWFTTLIKSDGFKVRGHFRLQPYKEQGKKLIWIQDFEKHGYTIKARMESDQIKRAPAFDESPAVED